MKKKNAMRSSNKKRGEQSVKKKDSFLRNVVPTHYYVIQKIQQDDKVTQRSLSQRHKKYSVQPKKRTVPSQPSGPSVKKLYRRK